MVFQFYLWKSKLSIWKNKLLSFGGRVTLIKSVLVNLPVYYMSLFRMPKEVMADLEKIQRQFLWGDCEGKKN